MSIEILTKLCLMMCIVGVRFTRLPTPKRSDGGQVDHLVLGLINYAPTNPRNIYKIHRNSNYVLLRKSVRRGDNRYQFFKIIYLIIRFRVRRIPSLHPICAPSTYKRPQRYLPPHVNTLPPCPVLGLKRTTTTSWAAFSINTQGKIPYTSTHKKGVLITRAGRCGDRSLRTGAGV